MILTYRGRQDVHYIACCYCMYSLFRLAVEAIRQLHPEQIAEIESKALWSKEEEKLLSEISCVSVQF